MRRAVSEGPDGRSKKIFPRWLGLAAILTVAARASAVEATLVADAHVNSARPAVNSGTISNLNVGAGYTALLQFDLATLPAGTTASQISRAVLRLYCNRADTAGAGDCAAGKWGVGRVQRDLRDAAGAG